MTEAIEAEASKPVWLKKSEYLAEVSVSEYGQVTNGYMPQLNRKGIVCSIAITIPVSDIDKVCVDNRDLVEEMLGSSTVETVNQDNDLISDTVTVTAADDIFIVFKKVTASTLEELESEIKRHVDTTDDTLALIKMEEGDIENRIENALLDDYRLEV